MTSLRAPSVPQTAPVPPDLRRATRRFAAFILPIGPALIAVLRYVLPYSTTDDEKAIVREVAAHQRTQSAVVWLGFAGVLLMVPAVLWVARLCRPRAPRLTAIALLLLVPGYTALAFLVASDAAVLFAVRHRLPVATAADMYTGLHPIIAAAGGAFVLGHVVGTVLLGCALLRSRVVPKWAAAATIVAQPLHFIAAIVVSSHALDLVGWGLNAVGFAAVSVAILRARDDEWDVAPVAGG